MSIDKGNQSTMTLQRMESGGYIVIQGRTQEDYGMAVRPVFASTLIDDALAFIRNAVAPVTPEPSTEPKA